MNSSKSDLRQNMCFIMHLTITCFTITTTSIFSINVIYETEKEQQLYVSTDVWLLPVSSKNSVF